MNNEVGKSIYLTVDRREQVILVSDILYAQVADKLCTIFLTRGEPIRVFLTLNSLAGMLPAHDFIQISRSSLVSLRHMRNINKEYVILSDGSSLLYSQKKKSAIVSAFQKALSERARTTEALLWKLDFSTEYRCMDRCPIPFFVLEIVTSQVGGETKSIVRYANDAMASVAHTPLTRLINQTFTPAPVYNAQELSNFFTQVAYEGVMKEWYEKHFATNTPLHVICYQPLYGFCACFILSSSLAAIREIE